MADTTVSVPPSSLEKVPATETIDMTEKAGKDPAASKGGSGSLFKVIAFGTFFEHGLQIIGAIAAIGAGTALPLMTLVFGRLVNVFTQFGRNDGTLTPDDFRQEVNNTSLYFVYLFIGKFVAIYVHTICFTITADRTVKALRLEYLRTLLSQEVSYFEDTDSSGVAGSITTNFDSIQAGVADKLGSAIQAAAMFIAAFVVAFTQQWKLTLVTATILPGIMVLMGATAGSDTKVESSILKTYDRCGSLAEEVLGSMRTVVANGAMDKIAHQYNSLLRIAEAKSRKKGPLMGIMFSSQFFFMFSGYALSFWFGLRLYRSGEIQEPGVIITVFFSILIALSSLMAVGPNFPAFGKAAAAAEAVFALLMREERYSPETTYASKNDGSECEGNLAFQHVSFCYPSRPSVKVLSNATLKFPKKTVTAIVGPSGSGKSTVLALLERLFDPTEGKILLDGHDTRQLDRQWLRGQIAYVQQEPQLFNTTIFENVAFGLVGTEGEEAPFDLKLELVKEACIYANAYGFIQRLPNGLDTVVGDRAGLLSGGQKQRIGIARAIIGNRPILLLDEATSALDPHSEAAIESLSYASLHRTTIIISHRLSTAKKAGKIVLMDKGEVAEQGTHESLMQAEGAYSRLVKAQNLFIDAHDGPEAPRSEDIAEENEHANDSLAPSSGEEELRVTKLRRRSLLKLLSKMAWEHKRHWLIFTIGVTACIAGGGIFPVQAVLFSRIITVFQKPLPETVREGNFWALMFFVVALGALLAYAALGFFMTLLGTIMTRFYRYEYFRSILRQDMAFFDDNPSGALSARLSKDPTDLHELVSVKLGLIITVFVSIIGSITISTVYGWKLALVTIFGALPFIFAAGYVRLLLDSALSEATAKLFEESSRFAAEATAAIRTVKSLILEATVYASYEARLANPMKKAFRRTFIIMIFFALCESFDLLATALAFWYGGRLISTGEYSPGQFFTVFIAIIMGGQAAGVMFGFSSNFNKARRGANNIMNLREELPPINSSTGSVANCSGDESDEVVDFQNVSFAYPTRPRQLVLQNLDLQVRRGQTLALVGPSGCGKTTVISLLERFYDIQSGQLMVYGDHLSRLHVGEYRKTVSLVSQEPVLYRGSIRDNVMFGVADDVSEAQFLQACKDANIHTFVTSLPEGYQTECGPMGVALSGGQRQRVAIARALIRNPKILLLDEATSALDTENEKLVQEALDRAGQGRTTIVIAHRLSTIRNADMICVFAHGRIVERGTHTQLVAQRGSYFKMCQAQAVSGPGG